VGFWKKLDASHHILGNELPLVSPFADNSHLERITYDLLYGPNTSFVVNRDSAMSIPAVAKGRNFICSSIGRMPLVALRDGHPVPGQPTFLSQIQLGVPNFTTVSWIVDHLLFFGQAFLLVDGRQLDGRPKNLKFVPHWQLETDDQGRLVKAFEKPVRSDQDYIRIDANNEGFLKYGAETITEAKEIDRAAAEAGASPVPSIVLKQKAGTDMTQAQIDSLLAGWSAKRRKRGGGTAFANSSIDVEEMGQHAENLLIDARNYSVLQVARALNLPAFALDGTVGGSSLSYSNSTSRMKELIDFSLMPYMASIEQTLSMLLPAGQTVEFDTTVLLRGSFAERMDGYKVAVESGVYTANELRAIEHLEPLADKPVPVEQPLPVINPEAGTDV
jgi:HK97 family phage portal protein